VAPGEDKLEKARHEIEQEFKSNHKGRVC